MIYNNGTSWLGDITDVGKNISGRGLKLIGYKTFNDLEDLCCLDTCGIDQLRRKLEAKGHKVLAITGNECSMRSGALYVYAPVPLQFFLARHIETLQKNDWPFDSEGFVRKLANDWVEWDTPLRRVIDMAFANFGHEKSKPDMITSVRPAPVPTASGVLLTAETK